MDDTRSASGRTAPDRTALAARLAGAAALAATGAIHLDLYLTGYRHIPTIGWMFLAQVIVAFGLAVIVAVTPGPLASAAGAGFAIATLGGYLLSLWVGLFGFQELRTTAGLVAGVVEIAAFGLLGFVALRGWSSLPVLSRVSSRGLPGGAAGAAGAAGALAVVALVVLGVSAGTASSAGGSAPSTAGGQPGGKVVKVIIKNFMFMPDNPDVSPGERIEVTNQDSVAHTLTAGPAAKDNNQFTTGLVGPGQTKFVTAPKKSGMYPFYCTIHHFMTGMLIVGK